jgi:4,5-dihydroxyphthalate decarboxylase
VTPEQHEQQRRWVAQSLVKAFTRAKAQAMAELYDSSALRFMLPWLIQQLEQAHEMLGADFWSYGLEANHATLGTFLRYHYEQGLSARLFDPAELFVPEALESAVI